VSTKDFRPNYITVKTDDDVSTVGFILSDLTDEENIELLGHELFTLVDQIGCRKMILNMKNVRYMTSSVLGKLISLHRKLHRNEGRLVICNIGEELDQIMSVSRLNQYFHLADDLGAAGVLMADG
jgi:anti-sigma B factor antagonist